MYKYTIISSAIIISSAALSTAVLLKHDIALFLRHLSLEHLQTHLYITYDVYGFYAQVFFLAITILTHNLRDQQLKLL